MNKMATSDFNTLIELTKLKLENPEKYNQVISTLKDVDKTIMEVALEVQDELKNKRQGDEK